MSNGGCKKFITQQIGMQVPYSVCSKLLPPGNISKNQGICQKDIERAMRKE